MAAKTKASNAAISKRLTSNVPRYMDYKPGQKCTLSGQYVNSKSGNEATVTKGETLPPGPRGSTWRLADATKHAPRKRKAGPRAT